MADEPTPAPRPLLLWSALVTVYVVWGSTYLGIRYVVEDLPPMIGTAARFVVAVLLLLGWLLVRGELGRLKVDRRQARWAMAVGALLLVGGTGMVGVAEQDVPSGVTALVVASVPLMVILLRRSVGERVRAGTLVSVLVGFAGIGLLTIGTSGTTGDISFVGLATVLAASAFWSVGSFLSGRVTMPGDGLVSALIQMATGAVVCLLVGALLGELGDVRSADVTRDALFAIGYLAVFGSVIAFSAYSWLLQHAPIQLVSTYAYVNPAVAVALGALFVDEAVTATMLAAGAVILGSVAFTIRNEAPRDRTERT